MAARRARNVDGVVLDAHQMKRPGQSETEGPEDHAGFGHAHRSRKHDVPESHAERSRLPGQFLNGADVSQGADERVADEVRATACSFELGDGLFGEEPAFFLADRAEPADLGAHALGQKGIAAQRQRCVARIENDDVEADLCRRGRCRAGIGWTQGHPR